MCSQYDLPFVVVPSEVFAFRFLLSHSPLEVSRICKIIVNYKKEIETLFEESESESESEEEEEDFEKGDREEKNRKEEKAWIQFKGRPFPKLRSLATSSILSFPIRGRSDNDLVV